MPEADHPPVLARWRVALRYARERPGQFYRFMARTWPLSLGVGFLASEAVDSLWGGLVAIPAAFVAGLSILAKRLKQVRGDLLLRSGTLTVGSVHLRSLVKADAAAYLIGTTIDAGAGDRDVLVLNSPEDSDFSALPHVTGIDEIQLGYFWANALTLSDSLVAGALGSGLLVVG